MESAPALQLADAALGAALEMSATTNVAARVITPRARLRYFFTVLPFAGAAGATRKDGADGPRLPDFLAWSSPGAPHRGGGLPTEKPGLDFDTLDRDEH